MIIILLLSLFITPLHLNPFAECDVNVFPGVKQLRFSNSWVRRWLLLSLLHLEVTAYANKLPLDMPGLKFQRQRAVGKNAKRFSESGLY